jgi:hypothetical protein
VISRIGMACDVTMRHRALNARLRMQAIGTCMWKGQRSMRSELFADGAFVF